MRRKRYPLGYCKCSSSGGYLSCSGKKDTKEAGWGGFELIAPAIKATSPDPSRRAPPVVQYSFPPPRKWSILATALHLWTERNGEPFHPKTEAPTTFPAAIHPPPCHCEAGFARRGNLLSVGSCVCHNSLSLRASPQTGVAIRSPIHVPSTSLLQKEYGLPRLFEPRNDMDVRKTQEPTGRRLPRHFVARNDRGGRKTREPTGIGSKKGVSQNP